MRARYPQRRRTGIRHPLALALVILAVAAGAFFGLQWYWQRYTLVGVVQRGLALLASADNPATLAGALDQWEQQAAGYMREHREELIRHLYASGALQDARRRALLARVAGADYGARREDWERWFEARGRLQRGQQPKIPARQQVELNLRWQAPVGLTAWFSTILALDGQVYIASLGAAFEDPDDTSDGIVRVDGKTGQAELIFEPPDSPPRDVLGIAAGDECLFAACRNGWAYCVEPGGKLRWKARLGEPLGGPPLSLDFNRDGVTDLFVVTGSGRVAALNGKTGSSVWTSPAARGAAQKHEAVTALGAAMAAGNVLDDSHVDLLVTTPDGEVRVLAPGTGKLRWKGHLPAGTLAGPLVCAGLHGQGPPAYVADRDARVWALVRAGSALSAVPAGELIARRGDGVVAALRTQAREDQLAALIACPTGSVADGRSSVCALEPEGVRWRYPPGGAVWATPVVANLNGDKQTEIAIGTLESDGDASVGTLTVLSATGQCLRRLMLPAPVDCSPVVADVDGDERLELLIADQGGWLHCFATGQRGPVEWGSFGGDSHNTRSAASAFRYAQVPFGMQWRWKPD